MEIIYSSFITIIIDSLNIPLVKNKINNNSSNPKTDSINQNLKSHSHFISSNINTTSSSPPCPWWNSECDQLIAMRKKAFTNFIKNKSILNFIECSKYKNKVRLKLKEIKTKSFRSFCESLNKFSNPNYIWRKVKCFKNIFTHQGSDYQYNESSIATVKDLISNLFPPWVPIYADCILSNYHNDPFLDLPFSSLEFETVIDNLNSKSSPGLDNVNYKIIKHLPASAKRFLLILFNKMFTQKFYPSDWNKYVIFFIPKSDNKKFRPISLASCDCKIFERLIYNRLMWWLEYHNILPNSQFGFRRNRSCIDNLSTLCAEINLAKLNNEYTSTVFLDIIGAFDNVLIDILVQKVKHLGLPPTPYPLSLKLLL